MIFVFDKGLDKILKKVGEEATEVVIAAKNEDPLAAAHAIHNGLTAIPDAHPGHQTES